jgi:signal transduction histidine kinase
MEVTSSPSTKVLVVEDELIAAENLALKLRRGGYTVVDVVDTGMGAITAVEGYQPDIVLMDIMLKGDMDGIEAAEQIFQQWQIPIIFMTAFADLRTIERAKASVPFGYVVKPFRASELIAVMEIALNQYQYQKHMEGTGKQRGDLLSLLSHEFRNPLSTILMATEMLEIKGDNWNEVERDRRLQRIKSAALSLSRLVEDVVMASRAEANRYQPELAEFNIVHFCSDFIQQIQGGWEGKYQIRYLPLVQRSPSICLDPQWFSYILGSLLANAAKYSPVHSVIDLNLELLCDRVILQIKDQSRGTPNADATNQIEPFLRGRNLSDSRGSGLGLVIVKKLVDAQRGNIRIESVPERGTTFRVELPLASPTGS